MENLNNTITSVIFVDIDGVFNYDLWYYSPRNPGNLDGMEGEIDPLCVARINHVCEVTDSKIVISSDWRISSGWKYRLREAGIKNIIDCTPILIWSTVKSGIEYSRGDEIQMWLNDHPEIKNYAIIDDRTDFLDSQLSRFVHVDSHRGLTDEDSMRVIEILMQNS